MENKVSVDFDGTAITYYGILICAILWSAHVEILLPHSNRRTVCVPADKGLVALGLLTAAPAVSCVAIVTVR